MLTAAASLGEDETVAIPLFALHDLSLGLQSLLRRRIRSKPPRRASTNVAVPARIAMHAAFTAGPLMKLVVFILQQRGCNVWSKLLMQG